MAEQHSTHTKQRTGSMSFTTFAVAALLVALLFGIGGTLCALADAAKHTTNEGYGDAKLIETYKTKVVTDVYPGYVDERTAQAQNVGSETMYVRMKINKYWADRSSREGNVDAGDATGDYGDLTPSADKSLNTNYIQVNLDDTEKWVYSEDDGYYYYTDAIAPNDISTSLLASVGISTEVGEEQNNNKGTDANYGGVDSKYLTKAAVLDIDLQAVTTYEEKPKPGPEPEPEPKPTPTPDNTDDNDDNGDNTDATTTPTALVPTNVKSAFLTKTGDGLSPLVVTLFALALVAFLVCIFFLIIGKRRQREEEQEEEVTVMRV